MKTLFAEILDIDGVMGVMLLDTDGRVLFQDLKSEAIQNIAGMAVKSLAEALDDLQEAELVFENHRITIAGRDNRLVLVFMESHAPVAMVRINCNILFPAIAEKLKKPKGFARFFKRK